MQVSDQASAQSQVSKVRPAIARYLPFAAAGGYRHRGGRRVRSGGSARWPQHQQPWRRLEQGWQVFLAAAVVNPYFWFSFWELAAICVLLLWLAKERMDRKDTEWEAAAAMADLANYATNCKRNAIEAITTHNEHIEMCNRVIEAAETGRPVAAGREELWRTEMETLRTELAQKSADTLKLAAQLEEKNKVVTGLAARVNRLTAELQTLRGEGGGIKRGVRMGVAAHGAWAASGCAARNRWR